MYSIIGKTPNMMHWRTIDTADDLQHAKEKEIDLLREKGFSWRIRVKQQ